MKNPNGMDTIEARKLLWELRQDLAALEMTGFVQRIDNILPKLYKQKRMRQGRVQQRIKIDAAVKAVILAHAGFDGLSNADIAVRAGLPPCASGRVSEVLQGLR